MDINWFYNIILLILLFLLSAVFSGSEVALFSLDKKKLKAEYSSRESFTISYILKLLDFPRRLLVTILISNTLANVALSIISVSLAIKYAGFQNISIDLMLTIQIILLTILILIFSEVTPKVWAAKNPLAFAKFVAVPLYWINVLIYPVSETLTEFIKYFASKIKFDKSKSVIKPEEISELADVIHEKGTIEEDEHELIHGIVGIRSVSVREVMTPRVDMTVVSVNSSFEEISKLITESGHTRIPLIKDDLDEILGIIYAKDLLHFLREKQKREELDLIKTARKAMFIPETKMIDDLMQEFQEKKMHIAIVVDEYGGTAGLITLEDIIEEIIGEIRDEYDKEENLVAKVDEDTFMVLGKLSIDEFKELLNVEVNIENEDFDTVGGLVLNYAGQIPREGYSFRLGQFKVTVKEISNKRIKKVLVEKFSTE